MRAAVFDGERVRVREDAPSAWVLRFAPLVPAGATVLDLACGRGRHGRLFHEQGCRVTFVDRDLSRLPALDPAAETIAVDLETGAPWPFAERRWDAVVVTNYLSRPVLPDIVRSVAPNGLLLYETFLRGQEAYGRPRNPKFLLRPGELLEAVRGLLTPIAFEQGRDPGADGTLRLVQRLCARHGDDPSDISPERSIS